MAAPLCEREAHKAVAQYFDAHMVLKLFVRVSFGEVQGSTDSTVSSAERTTVVTLWLVFHTRTTYRQSRAQKVFLEDKSRTQGGFFLS